VPKSVSSSQTGVSPVQCDDSGNGRVRVPLVMKIIVAIVVLIALGLGLISYLGYARFVKVYRQIEDSRFSVVLVELKSGIELNMTLGLPLAELPDLGRQVADSGRSVSGIRDLLVVSPDGRILVSATGAIPAGGGGSAAVPMAWLSGAATDSDGAVRWFSDGALSGLVTSLYDSFGRKVGAVVLTYQQAEADAVIRAVFNRLARLFALVFVGFAGLAAVAVWVCFRPVGRSFVRMTELLRDSGSAGTVGVNELEQQVVAFRGVVEGARSVIRQASQRLPVPKAWSLTAFLEDADLNAEWSRHGVPIEALSSDPDFVALIERGFRRFVEETEREGGGGPRVLWSAPVPPLVVALSDPMVRERLLDHGLDAEDLLADPGLSALVSSGPASERKAA